MNTKQRFTIDIDHKFHIIRYKHSGNITDEEIAAAWAEFLSLPEFTQMKYNLLSDYRGGKFLMPLESVY